MALALSVRTLPFAKQVVPVGAGVLVDPVLVTLPAEATALPGTKLLWDFVAYRAESSVMRFPTVSAHAVLPERARYCCLDFAP